MSTIKFSHEYLKMPPGWEKSQLLDVFDKDYLKLSESFIRYDTEIKTLQDPKRFYKLPVGSLIVLLLKSSHGHIWTTIRRCTPEKRSYYQMMRGAVFDCIIEAH